jgi:hypothetical protein
MNGMNPETKVAADGVKKKPGCTAQRQQQGNRDSTAMESRSPESCLWSVAQFGFVGSR